MISPVFSNTVSDVNSISPPEIVLFTAIEFAEISTLSVPDIVPALVNAFVAVNSTLLPEIAPFAVISTPVAITEPVAVVVPACVKVFKAVKSTSPPEIVPVVSSVFPSTETVLNPEIFPVLNKSCSDARYIFPPDSEFWAIAAFTALGELTIIACELEPMLPDSEERLTFPPAFIKVSAAFCVILPAALIVIS